MREEFKIPPVGTTQKKMRGREGEEGYNSNINPRFTPGHHSFTF
jgi:hypothetical protein